MSGKFNPKHFQPGREPLLRNELPHKKNSSIWTILFNKFYLHKTNPQYKTGILVHFIKNKFGQSILKYLQIIWHNTENTWILVFYKSVRRGSVILTEKNAKNFVILNKTLTKNGTVLKNNKY